MAEAIFRQLVSDADLTEQFRIESAGTGSWLQGSPPHQGTQQVLSEHGIPSENLFSRPLRVNDLFDFDYIVVMDIDNLRDVRLLSNSQQQSRARIHRLLEFADPKITQNLEDVPDPIFDGDFQRTFRLIQSGCQGLLAHIIASRFGVQ